MKMPATKTIYPIEYTEHGIRRTDGDNPQRGYIARDTIEPVYRSLAQAIHSPHANILDIGYGLGVTSDEFMNQGMCESHTIVELHPEVAEKAKNDFCEVEHVRVLEGDWLDVDYGQKFDAILFDPTSTGYDHRLRAEDYEDFSNPWLPDQAGVDKLKTIANEGCLLGVLSFDCKRYDIFVYRRGLFHVIRG